MAANERIAKSDHPALIRAVCAKYGRGPWVYADLVVVADEIGLISYPSILHVLRINGWINPVTKDGAALRRQRHGNGAGPKLWAVSALGLKRAGAVGVAA